MIKIIKKIIYYGFFGILTTIINILCFGILDKAQFNYKTATILAWMVAVIFAYITNKKYVFKSNNKTNKIIVKEFNLFIIVRVISLLIDLLSMNILINHLNINNLISKIISNVIVIVINYIASELIIFKKE